MDFPNVSHVFQVGIPADKESYIHRLGRTARAGREGRGTFIVTEAETFFTKGNLKEINFIPTEADTSSAAEVQRAIRSLQNDIQPKVYQAWMGYYKNHLKGMRWNAQMLVAEANKLALEGLGCTSVPEIDKKVVGKMGLKGVPGLNLVNKPAGPGRNGPPRDGPPRNGAPKPRY